METRLKQFADGLIEAGWLLLLAVTPSVTLLAAFRSFEAPKVAVLRSIGLILILGWLIRDIEPRPVRKNHSQPFVISISLDFLRRSLLLPVVLFSGSYLMATVVSTAPRLSLWGSYGRLQGAYTLAAYVALFLVVRYNLRSWRQIQRLIDVVLLSSFPVAVFAILQFYGLAPSIWVEMMAPFEDHLRNPRPTATLGNPIFLGSYLILVIPLTFMRLQEVIANREAPRKTRWLAIGVCATLLLVQEAALLLSQSRGPVGAHVTSLFLLVLIWAVATGRRRLAVSTMVMAGLVVLGVLALNFPNVSAGPLERLGNIIGLLQLFDLYNREIIWESVVGLLSSNAWRTIIGYGPETMAVAVLRHLTSEAAAFANAMGQHWDRAHNATWETLGTTGLVGLIAYLSLFGALFFYGLRIVGLITGKMERRAFVILLGCGAVIGAISPRLVTHSWVWTGLGIPAGLLAGLGLYIVGQMLPGRTTRRPGFSPQECLGAGLLAAMVAHFVNLQVAFGTTTTQLYFWVYAAVIGVLASDLQLDQAPDDDVSEPPQVRASGIAQRRAHIQKPGSSPGASRGESGIGIRWLALVVGGLLATLAVSFVFVPGVPLSDLLPVLVGSFAGTWLLGGLFAVVGPGVGGMPARRGGASYMAVSLGWFSLFAMIYFLVIRTVGQQIGIVVYLSMLIGSIALLAIPLRSRVGSHLSFWHGWIGWIYLPLAIFTAGAIWETNVRPIIADVYFNSGQAYVEQGDQRSGIRLYREALELTPNEDIYYLRLGEAYAELAQGATDPQQHQWFEAARAAAWQAWNLNPGQTYHALNLAHVYLLWAQATADPGVRTTMLKQAASLYAEASSILKYDPRLFREWGLTLQLQGDDKGALERYRTSLDLNNKQADAYRLLGYLYRDLGKLNEAEQALKQAVKLDPGRLDVHVALGEIYDSQGRLKEALAEAQHAAELAPRDYRLYLNLGLIYRQMGRTDQAAQAVQQALAFAPDDQRPRLEALLEQLKK